MNAPIPARRPLDAFGSGLMLTLCLCWGFQQVIVKLAAPDISPTLQLGLRSSLAALVLCMLVLRREGVRGFTDGTLPAGLLAGALFAAEFLLVSLGLDYTTASHMSVFLYTGPIFTALGLHFALPEERLSVRQWLGVALAFSGVALGFLGKNGGSAQAPNVPLGDMLGLLGGLAWGLTTVVVRKSALSEALPAKTLFYQLLVAAVALPTWSLFAGHPPVNWSTVALASVGIQAFVIAAWSYLMWFWLLRRYLASQLAVLSFATPLFGVSLGVLILGEPLDASFLAGAALVLLGILAVNLPGARRR